jgi:hypothetical protein
MKPKYAVNLDRVTSIPTSDEWSDIYDAIAALLLKLDKLTWADRDIALKEYLALHEAMEARGTKRQSASL